ncbi:MAG: DUF3108 domain-containing protein [Myxococcales bacterium]|nr:DUF3108 domain-containing protein [Myxococcales bacterium]MCB9750118.1 DUF3108 domain-containing protein [Myxococcales bacterium]
MRGAEPAPLLGWGASLLQPQFEDHTRRPSAGKRPPPLGPSLRPGERFRYDVFFSGNPTGIAEAGVVSREPDPEGGPPLVKLNAFARTSGVVALLTTITYELEHLVDAYTGAPVRTVATIKRDGLPGRYKRRETTSRYMGRGYVEIVDRRDDQSRRVERTVPVDTYDSLATMAWVRSLELKAGETAKIYALDGRTLLRVDITGRGPSPLESMPTIGTALGVDPDKVYELEGVITRVDAHGAAIPGKRTYQLRVWVSGDERRIPLVLESDMWLGVIRLILTQYDPPEDEAEPTAP